MTAILRDLYRLRWTEDGKNFYPYSVESLRLLLLYARSFKLGSWAIYAECGIKTEYAFYPSRIILLACSKDYRAQ